MSDGKVIIDTELDDKGLKSGLSGLGSKATSAISGVAKAATAAGVAAAAGVVSLTKKAVAAYSEYEQLVGGVETLFKESAGVIMDYANNAYMTAGLSANKYMETVTSFSASLLQSLGGDTAKAAQYADRAVIDMSDNANKMGTAIASIQWAYQGFAKQNYTMLDNLKLGYGGTKEEMQRLIHDASQMTDIQTKLNTAVKDGDMSFANIVNAIHVMQDSLGILGTTELEAATTIQGSLNMTKASWENLLTALGDPAGNVDQAVDKFVKSLETLGENALPIIENAMYGIAEMIDKLAPIIAERIPTIVSTILPPLISAASQIVSALIANLPQIISGIWQAMQKEGGNGVMMATLTMMAMSNKLTGSALTIFTPVGKAISKGISKIEFGDLGSKISSKLMGIGSSAGNGLVNGILKANEKLPSVLSGIVGKIGGAFSGLATVMTGPVGIVIAAIGLIVAAFVALYNTNDEFRASMDEVGASLMQSLAPIGEAFMNMINEILPPLTELATLIGQTFAQIVAAIAPAITEIISAITPLITMLISSLMPAITAIMEAVIPLIQSIVEAVVPVIQAIISAIEPIVNILVAILVPAIQLLVGIIQAIIAVITPVIEFIAGYVTTVINTVVGVITGIIQLLTGDFSGAAATFQGVLQGIADFFMAIWNNIASFFSGIWNGIISFLGSVVSNMSNVISNGINSVVNWFVGLPGRIMSALGNVGSMLVNAGRSIIEGFLNGLKAAFEGVKDFIGGIGSWIAEHKGPKEYDLKLLIPNGKRIMKSLDVGLEQGFKPIKTKVENLGADIRDLLTESVGQFSSDIKNSLGTINAKLNVTYEKQQIEAAKVPPINNNFYNMDTTAHALARTMRQQQTYGHYGMAGVYG